MVWVSVVIAFVALWVASLWRVLGSYGTTSVPSCPPFLSSGHGSPPLRRNVLLVIAHPDDESMFFTPTILYLNAQGHRFYILCMSTGDADGIGKIRREELFRACATLEIPSEQVKIMEHPKLQDGFNEHWDHNLLAGLIEEHIKMWNIDSLLSFDKNGVSGHPNHRDVHSGICAFLNSVRHDFDVWELVSEDIWRKYSGPLGIWLAMFHSSSYSQKNKYCLFNSSPTRSYKAMAEHASQWVWFRRLFVLFSSYTYMNTLQKISI